MVIPVAVEGPPFSAEMVYTRSCPPKASLAPAITGSADSVWVTRIDTMGLISSEPVEGPLLPRELVRSPDVLVKLPPSRLMTSTCRVQLEPAGTEPCPAARCRRGCRAGPAGSGRAPGGAGWAEHRAGSGRALPAGASHLYRHHGRGRQCAAAGGKRLIFAILEPPDSRRSSAKR